MCVQILTVQFDSRSGLLEELGKEIALDQTSLREILQQQKWGTASVNRTKPDLLYDVADKHRRLKITQE